MDEELWNSVKKLIDRVSALEVIARANRARLDRLERRFGLLPNPTYKEVYKELKGDKE